MKILRRLGFGELRMHLMHANFAGTTQGALGIRIRGELAVDRVATALSQVAAEHEMLNAVIVERDRDFFFALQDPSQLPELCLAHAEDPADGLQSLQAANEIVLDATRRLWRMHCVSYRSAPQVHDLILVMHHAAMDAQGADCLLHRVLSVVTDRSAELASSVGRSTATLPPSAESSCLVATSWEAFAATGREVAEQTLACRPSAYLRSAPLLERSTGVHGFQLSGIQLARLEAMCQRSNVTFNSLLSALLLEAVWRCSPQRARIALYTAVSLRRLCPAVTDEDLGCFLSVVPTFHAASNERDSWALAQEYQEALRRSYVAYGRPPREHDTLAVQAGMQGLRTMQSFANDIGFTYAESKLQARYANLEVQQAQVIARRLLGNVELVLHGLRLGNQVCFTMSHTRPLQDDSHAARVTATLQQLLQQACAVEELDKAS